MHIVPQAPAFDAMATSTAAALIALTGLYFLAGKLGLALAFVHPSATAVWPPTGIALAVFLLGRYRLWPAIAAGAFLVNLTTAGSVATSAGIALGNTLEGLAGAWLTRRFTDGPHPFARARDLSTFAVLAGMMSTTVSATVGVTSLALGGVASWGAYGSIWVTWWLGDAAGALLVAPLLVLWYTDRRVEWSRPRLAEAGLILLSVIVVGQVAFGGWLADGMKNHPLEFLCIPSLLWAAFRFGQREAATAVAVLACIAIAGTLRGLGPFARETPNESLLLLQAYMGTVAFTTMAVAAVVGEHRRAEAHRTKTLRGLLPICASCQRIRNEHGHWINIQVYVQQHSHATFTHGLCLECARRLYPQLKHGGRRQETA